MMNSANCDRENFPKWTNPKQSQSEQERERAEQRKIMRGGHRVKAIIKSSSLLSLEVDGSRVSGVYCSDMQGLMQGSSKRTTGLVLTHTHTYTHPHTHTHTYTDMDL